jgi:TolB protein
MKKFSICMNTMRKDFQPQRRDGRRAARPHAKGLKALNRLNELIEEKRTGNFAAGCERAGGMPLRLNRYLCFLFALLTAVGSAFAQIDITNVVPVVGGTQPVWVSLSGLTGEAAQVLQFDLYVQGFNFTNAAGAQFLISGSNNGDLQARATDNINKHVLVSKAYSGASLRRQVHAFADDFVQALGRRGIARTKVAFKGEIGQNGEIFIADFDGFGAQAVTKDNTIVAAPSFVPGRLALYYTSYKLGNPDIFYHDLSTGARKPFARYGGSNISPAASPDGSKVAMILSKDGWTDLYVCDADGSGLKRLTKSPQDESSPCWSPDGQWICYASKDRERRALSKISVSGGQPQRISTAGVPSPTEPDWSPDGKWIAFTAQFRDFQICVVPASGGEAKILAPGEDPSWAPNSRTLAYAHRHGGHYTLSLLDVFTKQVKDVSRISGSSSQSQPSWAR